MLLPENAKPYTGTWRCPLCDAVIPVTLYGIGQKGAIEFIDSPWPMADVAWHIALNHPEGMD